MTSDVVSNGYRDRLLAITLHLREAEKAQPSDASTRTQILAAAISLFTRKGYGGTSMREIAAKVGIKAASLYAHVPEGKEELLRLGLHSIFITFLGFVTREVQFEMSAREQLRSVVEQHIVWQLEYGDEALAWDAAVNQFGVVGVLDEDSLARIRNEQALYHNYLDDLVRATCVRPERAADISTAVRVMCDQAPTWLPIAAERATAKERAAAGERIWTLVEALLSSDIADVGASASS